MAGSWSASQRGLGSGKFWDFLTDELMPAIRTRYPKANGPTLAAGFSLGGYTVSLLTIKQPGLFDHAGIYDGLFMWPCYHDPRAAEEDQSEDQANDTVWTKGPLFDAAFDKPRNLEAMNCWNPTDQLLCLEATDLEALRQTTWWISCAVSDGRHGNRDRAEFYHQMLQEKNIPLGFNEVLFDENASHSWHWADKFLISFLRGTFTLAKV